MKTQPLTPRTSGHADSSSALTRAWRNPALVLWLLLGLLIGLGLSGCSRSGGGSASGVRYHCPMHPTYISDRPGDCPICHMSIVPIKDAADAGGHECCESEAVPGRVAIRVAPEKQQLIGLRSAVVETRELTSTLRATGTVQHDETALSRIAPRFSGWIQRLHINYTGQAVQAGDPVLTVYSPELVSTEREFLVARRQFEAAEAGGHSDAVVAAERLLAAARQRLEWWGIDETDIRELQDRGTPSAEVVLRAPASGHVITRSAVRGQAFAAGETLFEMGELDPLWVRVSIPELELHRVRVGQKAILSFPHLPGHRYESTLEFIYPHLDPRTRRAEARLTLPNPELNLRPEMWATVELELSQGAVLTVPASAVLDTGVRQLVFVVGEDHHLEPREVAVGVRTDDHWEILDGLEEGEAVVTRALFLIDSESQLRAAMAAMLTGGGHEH
jgi:membrane fusion protein, copper/silver efflux system